MTLDKARKLVDIVCAKGTEAEIDVARRMYCTAIQINQTDPVRLAGYPEYSEPFCNEMINSLDSEMQYRIDSDMLEAE